jgi:hypothetical protein
LLLQMVVTLWPWEGNSWLMMMMMMTTSICCWTTPRMERHLWLWCQTEPIVSEPSASAIEVAIRKFKSYTSPGSHQIPAELFLEGGGGYCILTCINLLCWPGAKNNYLTSGKSVVIPVHIKGEKLTSNYRGISLLTTSYKMLSNILSH